MENPNKILKLYKSQEEQDVILMRLHAVNDILNECDSDELLDIVQNKIIEAIDWYTRYCDDCGYMPHQSQKKE
ncbi:MAG: hypothetical protein JNM93_00905 [Bacteriovoracaceae bacterium]|nr:hypothetical protein [Bacteriovoracaceae bacterium]